MIEFSVKNGEAAIRSSALTGILDAWALISNSAERRMFTKRSILVGLVVLFAARLVSAAVGQDVTPFPGVYFLDDDIPQKARNAGLNDWLDKTMSLGLGFPFDAVVLSESARSSAAAGPSHHRRSWRYPNSGDSVTIDLLSIGSELSSDSASWGRIAYDPTNPTSLSVRNCSIDGAIPAGSTWSSGDILQGGNFLTDTMPSMLAIGSSGVGQVNFYKQPAVSGTACEPLGGLTEVLTNTGFGDVVALIDTRMWVNRPQSLTNPMGLQGGFDVFDLSPTLTSVDATLVGSFEGGATFEYYGAKIAGLSGGYMVAGSPYYSTGRATAFGMSSIITGTSSVDQLGIFELPGSTMLGSCVQNAGDVNDDNFDDVLVCSNDALYIVCGKTLVQAGGATVGAGAVLTEIPEPASDIGFAASVLANVDYNSDGVPDVAVSAPYYDPRGLQNAGRVYVYDSSTGALLKSFDGREAGDNLGGGRNAILSLGDVGARDGRLDFAFKVPGHDASFFLGTTVVTYTGDIDLRPSNHPFPFRNFKSLLEPVRPPGSRLFADR